MEAFSSTNLALSIRLSGGHYTIPLFLSDSEDASSSIWHTMFGYVVWKAFLIFLGGISTISTLDTSTMCKVYALHVSHPSQCIMVTKWGIPWMSQVLDCSPASKIFTAPFSSTCVSLISIAGSIFKQQLAAFLIFYSTP